MIYPLVVPFIRVYEAPSNPNDVLYEWNGSFMQWWVALHFVAMELNICQMPCHKRDGSLNGREFSQALAKFSTVSWIFQREIFPNDVKNEVNWRSPSAR